MSYNRTLRAQENEAARNGELVLTTPLRALRSQSQLQALQMSRDRMLTSTHSTRAPTACRLQVVEVTAPLQ